MSDDDEVVRCHQCGWPMLRGQAFTIVYSLCDDEQVHPTGVVHMDICAIDMAMGVERRWTQQHRAGAAGMN